MSASIEKRLTSVPKKRVKLCASSCTSSKVTSQIVLAVLSVGYPEHERVPFDLSTPSEVFIAAGSLYKVLPLG